MRLERFYNVLALGLVVLGIASSCTAEGAGPLGLFALAAAIVGWVLSSRERPVRLPRSAVNLLVVGAMLYALFRVSRGQFSVSTVAQLVIFLQLIKIGDRTSMRDDAQILLMATFLAIAAMLTSNSFAVGAQLLVFLPLLIGTAMAYQVRAGHERCAQRSLAATAWPEGAEGSAPPALHAGKHWARHLAAVIVISGAGSMAMAGAVFVLLPRIKTQESAGTSSSRDGAETGFADRIQLGRSGLISSSPEVVLDLEVRTTGGQPLGGPGILQYLRGAVLGEYDRSQREWKRESNPPGAAQGLEPGQELSLAVGPRATIEQRVTLRKGGSGNRRPLFGAAIPVKVRLADRGSVWWDPAESTLMAVLGRAPVEYTVWSGRPVRGAPRNRDTITFPSERVKLFTSEVLRLRGMEPDPAKRPIDDDARTARLIESYLRDHCSYSLDQPRIPAERDPIEWFLLDSQDHTGHCEYFASAMAAMCRSVGINARIVTGYVAAEFDPSTDSYIVRESNAHAWVEVNTGEGVWQTYDATPPDDLTRIHHASAAWTARARRWLERLEYLWNAGIVGFNEQTRVRFLTGTGDGSARLPDLVAMRDRVVAGGAPAVLRGLMAGVLVFGCVATAGAVLVWLRQLPADRWGRGRATARLRDPELAARLSGLRFYEDMLRALKRAGSPKPVWRPPLAHAETLHAGAPDAARRVRLISEMFYRVRFGGQALTEQERRAGEAAARELLQT